MSKMTLDEYLIAHPAKRQNVLYIHTDKKGDLFGAYGISPFIGTLDRRGLYEWIEQATAHLNSEELTTLTITARMLHQGNSVTYRALRWAMYSRGILFETVDDQNPAVIQAPDPISPDLPEEPDRV